MRQNSLTYPRFTSYARVFVAGALAAALCVAASFGIAAPDALAAGSSPANGVAATALAKVNIADCKISLKDREYTGKLMLAKGTVSYNGKTLEKDVDYTFVDYQDNRIPGTATVTVKGMGSYTGTVTAHYDVVRSEDNYLALPGKWVKTTKGYRYKYDHNGKYAAGHWLQDLDTSKLYRMSDTGYALTNLHLIDGKYYLFSSSTGYAKKGWQTYNKAKYYLKKDYTAAIGWMKSSDGRLYRFSAKGKMWRSTLLTIDGDKYYASKYGYMATGRKLIKGKRYVFDASTHKAKTGLFTYKSRTYYASDSGVLQTGWKTVNDNTYYFTSTGPAAESCMKKRSDGTYWYMDSTGKHNREAGAKKVLDYAQKLVNKKTPYLLNGDLKKGNGGTDCSGFAYYCYKHVGIKISRITTSQQYDGRIVVKDKASVALKKAKKGDLILTGYKTMNSANTTHVMIFAGTNSSGDYMAYDEAGVYNNGKLIGARYSKCYKMGISANSIVCVRRILS